ncbi:GtrA family protein [Streptomyces sp. NPDC048277]|uniref:GtrA family protein n=1 Tax=Streptomyces sp. NPDC048277 TaxID=3155027 RepID=UPI0033C3D493
MSGRHALPSRWGSLYREIAKFGLVGLTGCVVNLAVFNLVRTVAHWQPVRASVLATACAVLGNYVGLRYFAYRDRDRDRDRDLDGDRGDRGGRKELGLFLFFSAVGLVIENGVLYATTYGFGWQGTLAYNVSKFLGIGIATLFRFWSYRTWVFRTAAGPSSRTVARGEPQEPVLQVSWERS